MKNLYLIVIPLLMLVGCSLTPTKFDTAVANAQTNYYPVLVLKTNVETVFQTNTLVQTITVTNSVGVPVPVFLTNTMSFVTYQTNVVMATNQAPVISLTPNATSTGVAGIAGSIANVVAPGTGALVTEGILGLLGIFLGYRNRQLGGQKDLLSQAAGVLAQTIETGREIMANTPQGQKAADAFTQWMISHQADTKTIGAISNIVKNSTDNAQAKAAADQILNLIGQAPPKA